MPPGPSPVGMPLGGPHPSSLPHGPRGVGPPVHGFTASLAQVPCGSACGGLSTPGFPRDFFRPPAPGTPGKCDPYPGLAADASCMASGHRSPHVSSPLPMPWHATAAAASHHGESLQRGWPEACHDLERDNRRAQMELHERSEETAQLAREAQGLRDQIVAEQENRRQKVADMAQRLEGLERENRNLQMKLTNLQAQSGGTDVATVKKEVVAKTMELEKAMREFQQGHQDQFFQRVRGVTSAMQSVCQGKPATGSQLALASHGSSVELAKSAVAKSSGAATPSPAMITSSPEEGQTGTFVDQETQRAMRQRLESLGDVVVYTSDKFEACCASGRPIPPGSLRVRPRRCDHTFLVECLLPYWSDGLCPVCRCSFALDKSQDALGTGVDDCDRCSSDSASVSQVGSLGLLRGRGSSDVGAPHRGPQVLRSGSAVFSEASPGGGRFLAASPSRALRRARSSSLDERSDVSGPENFRRCSPPRRGSPSPARSNVSVHSASDMPRRKVSSRPL